MNSLSSSSTSSENVTGLLPMKRRKRKPLRSPNNAATDQGTDIWLITLSDLLMLLVIFFVILFGMELQKKTTPIPPRQQAQEQQLEKKRRAIPLDPSLPNTSAFIEKDLVAVLSQGKGRQEVTVKRVADLVTLTFPERIVFDPGHAQLKPSAQTTLDTVASFIRERPSLVVEVQGYTDDRPIHNTRYPSNWELSVDRATQVAKAIIDLGVNPSQLSVKGFGEYHPLNPNDSDENRLKNRRVEIQFSMPSPS